MDSIFSRRQKSEASGLGCGSCIHIRGGASDRGREGGYTRYAFYHKVLEFFLSAQSPILKIFYYHSSISI